jgi:hypothetical protein
MADAPYGEIADLLKAGRVVPFLGAGVNFDRRPGGASWSTSATFLPSGAELSEFLAARANFPSKDARDRADLPKVASYFAETTARQRLRQRLHEVFDRDCSPCDIHTYLAEIETPMLIVTTNYDDLTERAFARAGRPYDLVIHPTDRKDIEASVWHWPHGAAEPVSVTPNKLYVDLSKTTVIYKMHGSVHRQGGKYDSYVITEEDYVDFLSRMTGQTAVPAFFMRYFQSRYFLFLGYGLRDWNLRVVLRNLKAQMPVAASDDEDEEVASWAIQYQPSAVEVELWNARRVKIYDVMISEFVREMRAASTPATP